MRRLITTCAAVVMLLCTYASADIQYATDTGGAATTKDPAGTVGTEFTANDTLAVWRLGVYDQGWDGLADAHDVGLWRWTDGEFLASVTIPAGKGSPMDAYGYRWVAVTTPVTLVAGTNYALGAYYPTTSDWFRIQATIDAAFTLVADRYLNGSSLAMPTETAGNGTGWYGPNLQAVPVPVPAAVLIGLLGLGTAGLKLRKQV